MTKHREFARWVRIKLAELNWKGSDLQRNFELKGHQVASATISKWRKGQVQPSRENCAVLADIFNVPVEEVLKIAGHEPLESAGPLSELSQRISQLPEPQLAQVAIGQIEDYGNKLLDILEGEGETHDIQALREESETYFANIQQLFKIIDQLDEQARDWLLKQAQAQIKQ